MDNSEFSKSRRDLCKAAALAGIAGVGAMLPGKAKAEKTEPKTSWDIEYDVIVIGTGFGGNSAAMKAVELGLKTLVLEKMPAFGGNSSLNGGGMAVAGLDEQKEKDIEDSVEQMKQDIIDAGRGLAIPAIAETIARESRPTYDWVVSKGAKFMEGVYHYGGHAVPRIRVGENSSGADINKPLREAAQKAGAVYRANCNLQDFIKEDGRVVGVRVLDKAMWDRPGTGVEKYFRARKGVVVTTGGYSNDLNFRLLQDPRLTPAFETTNQPGGSAEGLKAMVRAGGAPRHLSWIQLGPWCSPDEKGYGAAPDYMPYAQYVHGIMVDVATGKRFVNELGDRRSRANAIIEVAKKGGDDPSWPVTFCDATGHNDPGIAPTRRRRIVKEGTVKVFDTVEEMAKNYGMPAAALKEQISEYNEMVKKGKDEKFGKYVEGIKPIGAGPYYAIRVCNRIHYTMGGIAINEHGEVLAMADGKPVPGLFAAGEVAAGAAGASRLGGNGTTDPLVMGRVAVKRIAKLS